MVKVWSDIAWNDYCEFFNKHQQKLIKTTHDLIKDIERNGVDKGKGQPEPLKYELSGYWSRRIDIANRLVYKIEDNILKIGAYDYIELKKNETFFFLDKICGIESSDEIVADIGISAKVLGNILHKTLEEIFRENWKNILQSSENLLISADSIEKFLKRNIWKEELKIEIFMKNYLNEVLL